MSSTQGDGSAEGPPEKQVEEVFERITDAVFALDHEWQFAYLNDRAEEVLGRDKEELLGTVVWDSFTEAVGSQFQEKYQEAMETQQPVSFEEYYPPLDTWFSVRAFPSETGLSVYFRDVTERKEMETELRERERQLSTLMSNVPGIVYRYRYDNGWSMEFASDGCEELTGYESSALEDEAVVWEDDVVVADDREGLREEITDHVENREPFSVTYRIRTADGEIRWVREKGRGILGTDDEKSLVEGVITDVTERVEYQQELEAREGVLREAYDVIADSSRSFDEQVAGLLEIGRDVTGVEYAVLGRIDDEQYVFESALSSDGDVEPGDIVPLSTRVCEWTASHGDTLHIDDIEAESPELTDRGGYESEDVNCYLGAPVFVDDEVYGVLCFYGPKSGEGRFSNWEETFVDIVSRWVSSELETRRNTERLAALNELNGVVRGISDAVIDQSTREEIEETACKRLANSDSYEFALVGEVDTTTQQLNRRTAAGTEGYLEDHTISVDANSSHPTAGAIRSGEIRTVQSIDGNADAESSRAAGVEYGFQSMASVPIVHEETTYGVLNIYTDRADAFQRQERAVVEHLGELVGHAIAAVERKRALMADELVELEFGAPDFVASDRAPEGTVYFERSVPTGDGSFLVYVDAGDVEVPMAEIAEELPLADSIVYIEEASDGVYELKLDDPPIISTIASLGGSVERAVIEEGDFRMVIHAPSGADVREVIDTVQDTLPSVEPLARRQVTRSEDSSTEAGHRMDIDLTQKQRSAVEAAYFAGFFEWPRESSGEEVAESLDISSPTFHQHVRAAENKVFSVLLDG